MKVWVMARMSEDREEEVVVVVETGIMGGQSMGIGRMVSFSSSTRVCENK